MSKEKLSDVLARGVRRARALLSQPREAREACARTLSGDTGLIYGLAVVAGEERERADRLAAEMEALRRAFMAELQRAAREGFLWSRDELAENCIKTHRAHRQEAEASAVESALRWARERDAE